MSVDPAAIGNLRLTDRTILALVVEGLANKEIAWQLDCDVRYVQNRLHVVYKQIGALNRVDAALAYLKWQERLK